MPAVTNTATDAPASIEKRGTALDASRQRSSPFQREQRGDDRCQPACPHGCGGQVSEVGDDLPRSPDGGMAGKRRRWH